MLDRIIHWSIGNRFLVLAAAGLLLVAGAWKAIRMPVDVFPDLTAPTVTVIAEAHGMAPEEVETQITFPIETAMNGAPGVRRVRSSTGVGIGIVWVELDWGADLREARQVVSEKLQLAQGSLPPEVERPVLAPVSSIMGEIMFIALTSERHTPMNLKTLADWTVRPRLLAVPGVSQVVPTGGDTKQYQVIARPERLSAYRLSIDDLARALRETNENTSAGFLTESGQQYLIHGVGRVRRPADIEETVVVMRGDQPVFVRDLAEVRVGPALKLGEGSRNGRPAVVIGIQKQPGANTLELTKRLDTVIADLQASLPSGMKIDTQIFRQADFIEAAVDNVVASLRDGAVLVIAVVLLFLASVRATAITVLAIPLSLVTTLLALDALGATINTMTLGGMAIAVGALVDDAIIDVENVVRRMREDAGRRPIVDVVFEASREIRGSIVFATLIIVLAFLPLFFLSGVEGRLLRPLGFAYVVALGASLVVALTVTPASCAWLLPKTLARPQGHENRVVRSLKRTYEPLLRWSFGRWKTVAGIGLVAFGGAAVLLAFAGRSFLPDFNEGTLTISAVTLPGTSLEESDRVGRRVEEILLQHPEVVATARRTGRAELDEHAQDVNAAEIDVGLRMKERPKERFLAALRRDFTAVPGTSITIGQPISHRIDHMLSGTRANVAVKVFGDDLGELRRLAGEVRAAMQDVPGVVDLSVDQQSEIPVLTIRFDRPAIARLGLRIRDVAEAVETAFQGQVVSRVFEGQASYDLLLRDDPRVVRDLDRIRATLVSTPAGAQVPLHALADVRKDLGPSTIGRENVQRKVVVMCNVSGRALGDVVEDVRARIQAAVRFPHGYHVEYGGQFESAKEVSEALLILGAVVLVGIFVTLVVAFRSARDAALVMLNLPLALIGGVFGVLVSGAVLSVASLIGFITLFGIATRNGIMLISHIRHLMEREGVVDAAEAVRRGAMERLSPILMTALAAGLALVPLALAGGEPGSEIQTPMATVILCGLITSTALNMVVVPALYLRFGGATTLQRPTRAT